MPYKDASKKREFQRKWIAKKLKIDRAFWERQQKIKKKWRVKNKSKHRAQCLKYNMSPKGRLRARKYKESPYGIEKRRQYEEMNRELILAQKRLYKSVKTHFEEATANN